MPLIAAAAVLATGAAGCGQPYDDLLGVWQVTSKTENDTVCDTEGAAVTDAAPYLKFVEGEFFGQEYAQVVDCTDAVTCEEAGGLFGGLLYAEEISGGVRATIYSASHGGDPNDCLLSGAISDATVSGGMLRIATRRRSQDNVSGTACDSDDAKDRFDSMPCTGYEVTLGVRAP
ncbi:MAG TPA: hypothetical protein VM261_25550 [Kofleriaceae bacterium]|nr:hypothetical protein [Kofleriaceae bacterium]